jgi:hypothetical protein
MIGGCPLSFRCGCSLMICSHFVVSLRSLGQSAQLCVDGCFSGRHVDFRTYILKRPRETGKKHKR